MLLEFKAPMTQEESEAQQFGLLRDWLYEKLIKQETIDIGLCNIEIRQINISQDWTMGSKNIEADCRIIPRESSKANK